MYTVPSSDYFIVLVIFTAIAAVSLLLQAGMLVGMFVVMRRAAAKMEKTAEEARSKAMPVINQAQILLNDLAPKVRSAVANIEEISETVRKQAVHVNRSVEDLVSKANVQIHRVDEMVTATLDTVEQASRAVENAVSGPTRRIAGILNGVRTGVGVFLGARRERQRPASPAGAPPAGGPAVVEIPTQRQA